MLCCRRDMANGKILGGALYKIGKSSISKHIESELPTAAFATISISGVVGRVTVKLSRLLNDARKRTASAGF
jgi:hypothetical protein